MSNERWSGLSWPVNLKWCHWPFRLFGGFIWMNLHSGPCTHPFFENGKDYWGKEAETEPKPYTLFTCPKAIQIQPLVCTLRCPTRFDSFDWSWLLMIRFEESNYINKIHSTRNHRKYHHVFSCHKNITLLYITFYILCNWW